jgi:cobyrinic acid a,c-diamide synthase
LTGHEFHYASIVAQGEDPPFAVVTDPHISAPVRREAGAACDGLVLPRDRDAGPA